MQTRTLSEANLDAEIFTAPIVAAEMRRMLDTRREAIAAQIKADIEMWSKVVRDAGIRIE